MHAWWNHWWFKQTIPTHAKADKWANPRSRIVRYRLYWLRSHWPTFSKRMPPRSIVHLPTSVEHYVACFTPMMTGHFGSGATITMRSFAQTAWCSIFPFAASAAQFSPMRCFINAWCLLLRTSNLDQSVMHVSSTADLAAAALQFYLIFHRGELYFELQ